MTRLPTLRPRQVLSAMTRAGFRKGRQSGSHVILKHPDGREIVIPMHRRDLKRSTMLAILKRAGLTLEQFRKLL